MDSQEIKLNMTVKEAILKSLDDINGLTNYMEVHDNIIKNQYYDFGSAKTPLLKFNKI